MPDKATPLGDRVYGKHRKMLAFIKKKKGLQTTAQALRLSIENEYARSK